jgi:hypothetical protein
MFTVGAVFGFIAFAITISLLPGGKFVETVSQFSQVIAAYVLLLGAALAYRAAMSKIDHDKRDVELRRAALARSLAGEYEARIAIMAARIIYVGRMLKAGGPEKASVSLAYCCEQLSPVRKRLSALLRRLWENLHEASETEVEALTKRAIGGETLLRNLTKVLKSAEEHIADLPKKPQPRDLQIMLAVLANTLARARMIDSALQTMVDKRVAEIDQDRTPPADLSIFDLPKRDNVQAG